MNKKKSEKQLKLLNCGNAFELSKLKKKTKLKRTDKLSLSKKDMLFENLITVEELAVIFRLAPQTIRNWVALGKLPYVKIGKRHWFLKRSVQEWLHRKEKPQWP